MLFCIPCSQNIFLHYPLIIFHEFLTTSLLCFAKYDYLQNLCFWFECFTLQILFTIFRLIIIRSLSIIYNVISKVLKFLIFIELKFESCTHLSFLKWWSLFCSSLEHSIDPSLFANLLNLQENLEYQIIRIFPNINVDLSNLFNTSAYLLFDIYRV